MTINIGDVRRMTASYQDSDLAYVDPTTITLHIVDPSGNITTYIYETDAELVKDSTGQYHADYSLDEAGIWKYDWVATGTVQGTEGGSWMTLANVVTLP